MKIIYGWNVRRLHSNRILAKLITEMEELVENYFDTKCNFHYFLDLHLVHVRYTTYNSEWSYEDLKLYAEDILPQFY